MIAILAMAISALAIAASTYSIILFRRADRDLQSVLRGRKERES